MFASFLYPFPLRSRIAPFLWVAYKQMGDLGSTGVSFLASHDYFRDPDVYRHAGRFECHAPENPELGFRVASTAEVSQFSYQEVPAAIYLRLKSKLISDARVWQHLIRERDPQLVDWLTNALLELRRHHTLQAVLTWCNYASLSEAASRLELPVIHCELGPLRDPWYRPLGYLDFSGVNGNTECAKRMADTPRLPSIFSDFASLRAALSGRIAPAPDLPPDAEIGIPLQVEDDSNVLAYGNGFDMTLLIQYAEEVFDRRDILLRPHPGAHLTPKPEARVDSSATSGQFLSRCRRLLTLNSSVAVEAMMREIPVTILGESPIRHLAASTLDSEQVVALTDLEFVVLNYFVPYQLLFDPAYLSWRLSGPDEQRIRQRHCEILDINQVVESST